MNITMLVLNNFTNDARVHKEASTLAAAGHNVTVVALWQPGLAQTEYHYSYRVIRLRLYSRSWKNRLLSPPIKYLEYAWYVWRLTSREPAHIYHANDANTLPAAWLASKHNHAKLVYDAHELEVGRNFSSGNIAGIYNKIWSLPEWIFIHKVDSIITVSPSIAAELAHMYHIPTPQVIINCPEKSVIPVSDRLRQELNIQENQKILLYQGIVTIGRGIEEFFNAIQIVENTAGVILGDGTALKSFRDQARAGKWNRVYLPGKVPLADLPSYTASADLGIVLIQDTCLSYRLSLPNKLFEYMHAGIPVLGSDLPEIGRIIRETKTGEVCDPDDPQAIASAINSLISDNSRYTELQANARKAAKEYNWQNEGQKLLDVYAKL